MFEVKLVEKTTKTFRPVIFPKSFTLFDLRNLLVEQI